MTRNRVLLLLFVLLIVAIPASADPIVVGNVNLTFHANPGMYGGYSNIVTVTNLTNVVLKVQSFSVVYAPTLGWPAATYSNLVAVQPGTTAGYMEFSTAAHSSVSLLGVLSSPYFHINGVQYFANNPNFIVQIYDGINSQTRTVSIIIDATQVQQVPEPATFLLLGTGLLGASRWLRRRA